MEDFLLKTITAEDGEIKVCRSRSSAGYAAIKVSFGDQSIEFDSAKLSSDYEMRARRLAELLDEVVNNPCALPK